MVRNRLRLSPGKNISATESNIKWSLQVKMSSGFRKHGWIPRHPILVVELQKQTGTRLSLVYIHAMFAGQSLAKAY